MLLDEVAALLRCEPTTATDPDGTRRVVGPRVDALELLLRATGATGTKTDGDDAAAPHPASVAADDPVVLAAAHWALRLGDGNRPARRAGRLLLARALDATRAAEAASIAALDAGLAAHVERQWAAYAAILLGLEDSPQHLLTDLWSAVTILLSHAAPLGGGAHAALQPLPRPSYTRPVPFEWVAVLLERAFSHDNPKIRRATLAQALDVGVEPPAAVAAHAPPPAVGAGDAVAAARAASQGARGHGLPPPQPAHPEAAAAGREFSDQLPQLRVHGTPYGLLLPPWYVAGTELGAHARPPESQAPPTGVDDDACAPPSPPPLITALLSPAPCLLRHLGDSALYRGAEELFGKALATFVVTYTEALAGAHPASVPGALRGLLGATRHLAPGAQRRWWGALGAVRPSRFPGGALPHAVDAHALALLRATLASLSAASRGFAAERQRELLAVLVAWCDPAPSDRAQLGLQPPIAWAHPCGPVPLADALHTLACFSSGALLAPPPAHADSDGGSGDATLSSCCLPVSAWALRLAAGASSDDPRGSGGLLPGACAAALPRCVARVAQLLSEYLDGPSSSSSSGGSGSPLLLSAVSVSRWVALLPWAHAAAADASGTQRALAGMLAPLADALSRVHTHAYLGAAKRARALLLLQALLAQAQPRSRRLADAHLSRHVGSDVLPDGSAAEALLPPPAASLDAAAELARSASPLLTEFHDAARHAAAAAAPQLPPDARVWVAAHAGLFAAPEDDYAPLRAPTWLSAQLGGRALVCAPHVADEVAAVIEGGVAAALRGGGGGSGEGALAPRALSAHSLLTALRLCLDAAGDAATQYGATAARLLHSALSALEDAAARDGGSSADAAVRQTHALQTLAAVCSALYSRDGSSDSSSSSSSDGAHGGGDSDSALGRAVREQQPGCARALGLLDSLPALVGALLSLRLVRPRHASPAGGTPAGAAWAGLYSQHEACRWAVLATLVRAAARALLAAAPPAAAAARSAATGNGGSSDSAEPLTLAGLPLGLSDALAEGVREALDASMPDALESVLQVAGALLPACRAADESAAAYADGVEAVLSGRRERASDGAGGAGASRAPSCEWHPRIAPLGSCTLDALLGAMMPLTRDRKVARRTFTAYADGVLQPLLFLRLALHVPTGADASSTEPGGGGGGGGGGSTAHAPPARKRAQPTARKGGSEATTAVRVDSSDRGGGGPVGGGPAALRFHVLSQLDFFADDARPAWCLQLLTARLVRAWAFLLAAATGGGTPAPASGRDGHAPPATAATARRVLLSYAPVMVSLLLHREVMQAFEAHALADTASRAQLQRWMRRWRASGFAARGASEGRIRRCGWWQQASPDLLGAEMAALGGAPAGSDDGGSGSGSSGSSAAVTGAVLDADGAHQAAPVAAAHGFHNGLGDADPVAWAQPADATCADRGAGVVTRVQLLLFLEHLCDAAAAQRSRALRLQSAPATPSDRPTAVALQQSLLLRLADLNRSDAWRADVMPGTPAHGAKLRSWQALALLAARWGEVAPAAMGAHEGDAGDDDVAVDGCGSDGGGDVRYARAIDAYLPAGRLVLPQCAPHQLQPPPPAADPDAPLSDSEVARAVATTTAAFALTATQLPTSRQYSEAALVALGRRFPAVLACSFAVPTLRDPALRPQQAVSSLFAAADLLLHLTELATPPPQPQDEARAAGARAAAAAARPPPAWVAPQCAALARALFYVILQWLSSPVGVLRSLAQGVLLRATPRLFPATARFLAVGAPPPPLPAGFGLPGSEGDEEGEGEEGGAQWAPGGAAAAPSGAAAADHAGSLPPALRLLLPQLHQVAQCADLREMIAKQAGALRRLHPAAACSLVALLCTPTNEHGELVPLDCFTEFKEAFSRAAFALHTREPYGASDAEWLGPHVGWVLRAGILPSGAVRDERLREGVSPLPPADLDAPAAHTEAPGFNFQRKLLSVAAAAAAAAGDGDDARDGGAPLSLAQLRPHSRVLSQVAADGRRCQPLIVLAALVDKLPNLAGLARTCEIFGAQALVVADLRIRSDPQFADISVTAGAHMSLHECKPAGVLRYVAERRAQGYTIVGLEQAARSQRLGDPAAPPLPERMVLVLGAEREGLPVDVIAALDVVVEVPQLGLIRSLNVHVAGALVVWEYTRQRLAHTRGDA